MATVKGNEKQQMMDQPEVRPPLEEREQVQVRDDVPESQQDASDARFVQIGRLAVQIREQEELASALTACMNELRDWVDAAGKRATGNADMPSVHPVLRRYVDLAPLIQLVNQVSSGNSKLAEMREELKRMTAPR